MQAAVIEEGVVTNLVVVDSLDALPGTLLVEAPDAAIGDRWDGEQFLKPATDVDLAVLKAAKNLEINQWRDAANSSTFPHEGKLIACDALSFKDIASTASHIALFDAFPADFPGGWKATDNTLIPLPDIDAFKALYASMTAQGTANFLHAQDLKAALAAAATPEEVGVIAW